LIAISFLTGRSLIKVCINGILKMFLGWETRSIQKEPSIESVKEEKIEEKVEEVKPVEVPEVIIYVLRRYFAVYDVSAQ
jgi:hypothetical protein